jgi:urea carboxylase
VPLTGQRPLWLSPSPSIQALTGVDAYDPESGETVPTDGTAVESPVPGSVWKILVEPGREVSEGEPLIIVESMKMEIAVCAPSAGLVREVRCTEGKPVQLGQALVIMADRA